VSESSPTNLSVFAHITRGLVEALVVGLTDIHSPPGRELDVVTWAARRLHEENVDAVVQPVLGRQANLIATIDGTRPGAEVLLYSPIDTHIDGDTATETAWHGKTSRGELTPKAQIDGDDVIGLGANNPKGHAAAVLATAIAIKRSGVPFDGTLRLGLGAGGMPTYPSDSRSPQVGHGVGCRYMLEHGGVPDMAIIAKSGDAVAWEEPGLSWYKITIRGGFGYAGMRGAGVHRNPILAVPTVLSALESWLDDHAARHETELVRPQGAVTAVRAGRTDRLAFVPAECSLYVDVRTSPGESSAATERELRAAITTATLAADFAARGLDFDVERLLSIPGSRTEPGEPVIRRAIAAWEKISGRPHAAIAGTSGATDANILRSYGVPTARVGMPRVEARDDMTDLFARAMNVCSVPATVRLAHILASIVTDDAAPLA
jgi:acetylornithine deacetylase/succinyl-diaminopimelate desuccinylase-like protein